MATAQSIRTWRVGTSGQTVIVNDEATQEGYSFSVPYPADARLIAAAPRMRDEHEATADELCGIAEWLDSIDAGAAIARKLRAIESRHRALLRDIHGDPS